MFVCMTRDAISLNLTIFNILFRKERMIETEVTGYEVRNEITFISQRISESSCLYCPCVCLSFCLFDWPALVTDQHCIQFSMLKQAMVNVDFPCLADPVMTSDHTDGQLLMTS